MKPVTMLFLRLTALMLLCTCCADQKPCVSVHPQSGAEPVRISVELAQTAGERSMGLMYRRRLGRMQGMLFLFEQEQAHTFTMRNTSIPLDMIFMDGSRIIVGIIQNTKPYANGPFRVDRPSKYALEVNAGLCARHGISPGDSAVFINVPGHDAQRDSRAR